VLQKRNTWASLDTLQPNTDDSNNDPMHYLLIFLVVVILSLALRNALKRLPWLFYVLAVALSVVYFYNQTLYFPAAVSGFIGLLFRRAALATALFFVVMFIGVLSEGSRLRNWMGPVRKELSILACLLTLPHIVIFLVSLTPRIVPNSALNPSIDGLVAFWLSILLLALMILLGVTSFAFVRRHLRPQTWRRIQWLAYPFILLTYIHVLSYLLPAALGGGEQALRSVVFYAVLIIIYAVLRIRLHLTQRNALGQKSPAHRVCETR
jgi:DMSO/TMAO reductase YedYZ heme-binding membrane subunit